MRGGVLLDRKTGKPVVHDRLRIQLADRPEYLEHVEKLIGRAIEFPNLAATERNPPLYMDVSNAYSGDELGLPNRDMISEGVVGAGDLLVSAHGGANSVDVAAGSAWVLGDTTPNAQPNYRVYNDAIVNLGINPDPTNPRRVLVGAQITDQGFAGTGRTWALTAIHGTPAGSPVLPATPASFLPLANVLVPAAAASSAAYTFTDMRYRAMIGGGQATGGWDGFLRKVTQKQVVNSIVETDLLNGEFTIPPSQMGANGLLRLTAWGDAVNNTAAGQNFPRFKAKLGATTLLDTGVVNQWLSSAARFMWRVQVEILNLTATSQWVTLFQGLAGPSIGATAAVGFTTSVGNNNVQVTINQGRAIGAGAAAVDTTVPQTLAYTVTLPVASASLDWTLKGAIAELV